MLTSAKPIEAICFGLPFSRPSSKYCSSGRRHDIGILLDRAGDAQVRQLRPLVGPVFNRSAQLRERQHRYVKLLRQRLPPTRDLRHLLDAPVAHVRRATQELQVIDNEQSNTVLSLQPMGPRAQSRDGECRRVVTWSRRC